MEITKEMLNLAAANANHEQLRVMYDAMKAERDALAAQLAMVRKIFRDESLSASETLRKIPFVIDLAPEQCISELRAEAVTDAADKIGDAFILPASMRRETQKAEFYKAGWRDAFLFLKQYAASIRQEVK